jgi:hypothetical protein
MQEMGRVRSCSGGLSCILHEIIVGLAARRVASHCLTKRSARNPVGFAPYNSRRDLYHFSPAMATGIADSADFFHASASENST